MENNWNNCKFGVNFVQLENLHVLNYPKPKIKKKKIIIINRSAFTSSCNLLLWKHGRDAFL